MGLMFIKPNHSYSYQKKLVSREVFKNYFSATVVLTSGKTPVNLPTVGVILDWVDKLIENPDLLAPIKLTSHAKNSISVLQAMFYHLPYDEPNELNDSLPSPGLVRKFLLDNLDKPLIVTSTLRSKKKGLLSPKTIYDFNEIKGNISCTEDAGCYVFINNSTLDQYIGSAVNIKKRLMAHKDGFSSSKKSESLKLYAYSNNGIRDFSFGTIYLTTNF